MADKDTELRDALKRAIKTPTINYACKVLEVSDDKMTCNCRPIDGSADLLNVRIQSVISDSQGGVLMVPKVGSDVIVSVLNMDKNDSYISSVSKVTLIIMNTTEATEMYSTVKAEKLQDELDRFQSFFMAIVNVINNIPCTEPGGGAPSAFQLALKSAIATKMPGDFTVIKNENIKHA